MKVSVLFLSALALCVCLAACQASTPKTDPETNTDQVLEAKVIACEQDTMLVCLNEGSYDLYRLTANLAVMDDKAISPGSIIEIAYDGFTHQGDGDETASITNATQIRLLEQGDDLVGLYQTVFQDLFAKDPALNESLKLLAFDLSKAVNLSKGEKKALLYLMEQTTGTPTREATYDELLAEKLIQKDERGFATFETGLLCKLEVEDMQSDRFRFSVQKYKSALGTYGFSDCQAKRVNGSWSYTIGAEYIS